MNSLESVNGYIIEEMAETYALARGMTLLAWQLVAGDTVEVFLERADGEQLCVWVKHSGGVLWHC